MRCYPAEPVFYLPEIINAPKYHSSCGILCMPMTVLAADFVCALDTMGLWYTVIRCSMGRACFKQQSLNGKPPIGLE